MDSNLPLEMIVEILSRSQLKTLDLMRCTSKELYNLTYSSYFLDLCKKRNNIVSGFLVQDMKDYDYINQFVPSPDSSSLDLGFLPKKARILATSEQGIIVFESPHPQTPNKNVLYHVCKPTTKQISPLPNPKTSYLTVKLAIVIMGSKPSLHYKILRLSAHKNSLHLSRVGPIYKTYRCEIFDSVTCKWRLLKPLKLPLGVILTETPSITTRGSVHLLWSDNYVWRFDTYSEEWTVFALPIPTLDYDSYTTARQLIKYKGKLGLSCRQVNNGCWEIWVCTDDGSWEKVHGFNNNDNSGEVMALYDIDTSVMFRNYNELVFYRFKRDKILNKFVLREGRPREMFNFISDYEKVDLEGGQKLEIC